MNYKKILLITFFVSACLILILVLIAKRNENWKFVSIKRNLSGNLQFVSSISTDESIENIFISPDSLIYVQLLGQTSLDQSSLDLSPVKKSSKLVVPATLMDLRFNQETYSVFDGKKNCMTEISYTGDTISNRSFQTHIGRCVLMGSNTFIAKINSNENSNDLWKRMDIRGQLLPVKDPLKNFKNGAIVNDGFFFRSVNNTSLFYVNYYMSDLMRLDRSGNVEFKTQTIDNVQTPPKTISNGKFLMLEKNVKINNIDATADNQYIYVLSNTYSQKDADLVNKQRYIDIYSGDDGKYLHSILIPAYKDKKPYMVRKIKGGFLIAQGRNLVKYNLTK